MDSRYATALIGIALSLFVSALAWWYLDTVLFFLLVPFVPFLFLRGGRDATADPPVRECPACGFRTRAPSFAYCPRDGSRLRDGSEARETGFE